MSKADEEDYPLCFRLDSGKQKGKLDDQECFPEITIIEKLRGKRQMAKGNNTKAKIARVAWKLFHEKGYEETTIDEIILQSGTSKGSFYHYYSGKDELLASLPEIFDAKYEEVMQALDPEMDSFDKLMTLCFSVHDLIESDIPVGLLASLYSSQVVTKGDKHLLNQNRFYYKMVNQLVDEGQRRGQITRSMPYYEIAHMYALCERAIIYDYCISDGGYALGEYTRKTMPLLFGGVRVKQEVRSIILKNWTKKDMIVMKSDRKQHRTIASRFFQMDFFMQIHIQGIYGSVKGRSYGLILEWQVIYLNITVRS